MKALRIRSKGRPLRALLATEATPVAVKAKEAAADILLNIHLAELRGRVQKTQGERATTASKCLK